MNDLINFKGEKIRTITINGEMCWLAADITELLGYSNGRDALIRHCRCVVKHDIPHPQSKNKLLSVSFINEPDLYRLITNSKLPIAIRFEKWIMEDVLPMIRKHGVYTPPGIQRSGLLHDIYQDELIKLYSYSVSSLTKEISVAPQFSDHDHNRFDLVRSTTRKYIVFELCSGKMTLEKMAFKSISRGYHKSVSEKAGKRKAYIYYIGENYSEIEQRLANILEEDSHVSHKITTFRQLYLGVKNKIIEERKYGKWFIEQELSDNNFPFLSGKANTEIYKIKSA